MCIYGMICKISKFWRQNYETLMEMAIKMIMFNIQLHHTQKPTKKGILFIML
jgi:hypothetical protein